MVTLGLVDALRPTHVMRAPNRQYPKKKASPQKKGQPRKAGLNALGGAGDGS